MSLKQIFKDNYYHFLAGISTITFIITAFYLIEASKSLRDSSKSLLPIAEWATLQNDCIKRTFRINGKDTQGIPSKVWSCNGGGD